MTGHAAQKPETSGEYIERVKTSMGIMDEHLIGDVGQCDCGCIFIFTEDGPYAWIDRYIAASANPHKCECHSWKHMEPSEPTPPDILARLEYLRTQIDAEQISYGEISELESLAEHIAPGDVQLLEWASVPEFPEPEESD